MQLLAAQGAAKVPANAEVMATVGFGPRSEGGLGLEIALDITLPGVARNEAEALIEKAHHICAYSNAMRNNVAIKLGLIEA
jgi:organic hydroperoxide reductase OsmC/OhrA